MLRSAIENTQDGATVLYVTKGRYRPVTCEVLASMGFHMHKANDPRVKNAARPYTVSEIYESSKKPGDPVFHELYDEHKHLFRNLFFVDGDSLSFDSLSKFIDSVIGKAEKRLIVFIEVPERLRLPSSFDTHILNADFDAVMRKLKELQQAYEVSVVTRINSICIENGDAADMIWRMKLWCADVQEKIAAGYGSFFKLHGEHFDPDNPWASMKFI